MIKNTAGQVVGAQMTTAADGTDFGSTVTVYITGDNGTQTIGSVGSGVCTSKGRGLYNYLPSQAETNYNHVQFTFIGTGAISVTRHIDTIAGDAFTRLGAPVGASISADIAAVQADADNIQTRIPAALVSGRMDSSVGAMAANVLTAAATASDFLAEVNAEVVDVLTVDATVEPTSPPSATAPMAAKISWQHVVGRNKSIETPTSVRYRNDGDTADIGTVAVTYVTSTSITKGKAT